MQTGRQWQLHEAEEVSELLLSSENSECAMSLCVIVGSATNNDTDKDVLNKDTNTWTCLEDTVYVTYSMFFFFIVNIVEKK